MARAAAIAAVTAAIAAGVTLLVMALSIGLAAPTAAGAQPPNEPVPCEVAMVVGCVASITGTGGSVSLTLQVSDLGGQQAATTAGPAQSGGDTGQGATATGETGTATGETDGQPGTETTTGASGGSPQEQPERSDRPLQTTLDPWERGGLRSNFGTRSIPISHYQIGADVTGWLGVPDPLDAFVASQTNWAFTTSTFLVILATNALDWAFEFPLAEDLVGDAGVLAQNYTIELFGFGLATSVYGLALSVTMVVAGFKAVTKGMIAAGSEVVMAFAAYVVLTVLTLTSGFGTAGLTISRLSTDLAAGIASFAAGQEQQQDCAVQLRSEPEPVPLAGAEAATDTGAAVGSSGAAGVSSACSFGFALQRSLVELPYQNLQWGQVLDGVSGKERCAAVNLELLVEGPWGNDDEPRDRMRSVPECEENADFNHQATYIRLGIASANTIAAAMVTLLVLMVAAMLLWQQIKLLFLTVTMPHALVFAILPGRARKLAWLWAEHLVGVVIRTVILALGLVVWLSLFSLIVYEQLTIRGIFVSLFASIAMAISGFYGLYRLSGMTRRVNPVGGSGGTAQEPTGPERPRGGVRESVATRVVVDGARSTLRTVRRRSAPGPDSIPPGPTFTGSTRRHSGSAGSAGSAATIGGGPGDQPEGGAAASGPTPRPDVPIPIGAGRP